MDLCYSNESECKLKSKLSEILTEVSELVSFSVRKDTELNSRFQETIDDLKK